MTLLIHPVASNADPSFQVFAVSDKAIYNPNEKASINIIIDGNGKIEKGYLYFYAPDYLVKNRESVISTYDLKCTIPPDPIMGDTCCFPVGLKETSGVNTFTAELPSDLFGYSCNSNSIITNRFQDFNGTQTPFAQLKFTINPKAPSGETPLYLSFKYEYQNKTLFTNYIAKVKVTSFYERNVLWIALLGLAVATISVITRMKWHDKKSSHKEQPRQPQQQTQPSLQQPSGLSEIKPF